MTRPIHLLEVAHRMLDLLDHLPRARSLPRRPYVHRPEHDPPHVRAARADADEARINAALSAAEAKRLRRNAARLRAKSA
jgi:hypothetical protein